MRSAPPEVKKTGRTSTNTATCDLPRGENHLSDAGHPRRNGDFGCAAPGSMTCLDCDSARATADSLVAPLVHNYFAWRLKWSLLFRRRTAVTSVPYEARD